MAKGFGGSYTSSSKSGHREKLMLIAAGGLIFSALIVLVVLANTGDSTEGPQGTTTEIIQMTENGEQVSVALLTPQKRIQRGDKVSIYSFEPLLWPADAVPVGAVTNIQDLADFYARVDIEPGMPVQLTHLTKEQIAQAIRITSGMRAVTITVNSQSGLEGWARPGSRVDVALTFKSEKDEGELTSKVIVQNARVLSFDGSADEEDRGSRLRGRRTRAGKSTITLEVSPEDALKVQTSRQMGTLSLLMRAPEDDKAASVTEVGNRSIDGVVKKSGDGNCVKGTMKISGKVYTIGCDGSILGTITD